MAEANGFVVWAETIKQAPTERTQPAGFSQSVKWTSFDIQRPRIFRQVTRFDPVTDYLPSCCTTMATRRGRVISRSHSEMVKVSPHLKAGANVFDLDRRTLVRE